MITQPPTAVDAIGAATGAEHSTRSASNHALARIPAPSADSHLGQMMRDDETLSDVGSFAISVDQLSPPPAVEERRTVGMKRDSKSKLQPGKRLAVSLTRGAPSAQHRKASSAPRATSRGADVLPTPRRTERSSGNMEDRIRALEFQRAHDHVNMTKAYEQLNSMRQICEENTKLNMELRRDFYGARTATEGHLAAVEARFSSTEKTFEEHLSVIVAHQEEVARHLQGFEMQLPGRVRELPEAHL